MMKENSIKVGMADMKLGKSPEVLTTLGLGSCVGIIIYDKSLKIGGLAHIMLPDSNKIRNNGNLYKFADTAISDMLSKLLDEGCNHKEFVAKIAGGAQMFDFKNVDENMRIGTRNIDAVKRILHEYKIPITSSDVGSNYGRTIEFYTDTGVLKVKTVGHGIKEI